MQQLAILLTYSIVLTGILLLPLSSFVVPAQAHFEHFTHYNNRGDQVGPYYAYEALEPEYAGPNEPVAVMFSVQDDSGHDVYNIDTMVEIYSAASGQRIEAWPWTRQDIGDFQVFYTFPEVGNYQIVLSVAKEGDVANLNAIDSPRATLSSTSGCSCDRAIFNVSISTNFGVIWNAALLVSIILPLSVFGAVLIWNYKRGIRRSGSERYQKEARTDTVRYIIMLAAIAGGIVHLAVYAEHSSLRLEYSIFLLVAGAMQVAYGVVYTILTLAGPTINEPPRRHYQKKIAVNLFGLVGTGILLGLYAYSVILPPPLSPNDRPENIDIGGILAKSIEVFTVFGILYLMRLEKQQLKGQLNQQRHTR
jgi:hypothetical protein